MRVSLEELVLLLRDEHTVSSYELQSSGLVQTLLNILNNVRNSSIFWSVASWKMTEKIFNLIHDNWFNFDLNMF